MDGRYAGVRNMKLQILLHFTGGEPRLDYNRNNVEKKRVFLHNAFQWRFDAIPTLLVEQKVLLHISVKWSLHSISTWSKKWARINFCCTSYSSGDMKFPPLRLGKGGILTGKLKHPPGTTVPMMQQGVENF